MTLRYQLLIWAGLLLLLVVTLWLFRPILLPFVIGLALAYLLNPAVNALQRLRFSRGWATAVVLLAVLTVILSLFFMLVPLIVPQVIGLAQRLPEYFVAVREILNQMVPALTEWLGPERTAELEAALNEFARTLPGWIASMGAQIAQNSFTILGTVGLVIITPVVAFYLLLDWEGMVRGFDSILPLDHESEIKGVLGEINRSMAGVIRGQGGVLLIDAAYYATMLSLLGLNFGLAVGVIAGLLSFIPYFGAVVGFALSVGIALVQFWPNGWMVAAVAAVFLVWQFIEGNILYPKLVGTSIDINPVWLMFAVFAFSLLFGFVGLLLAVPLAAISGVLTRYAIRKYRQSSLYLGRAGEPVAKMPAAK